MLGANSYPMVFILLKISSFCHRIPAPHCRLLVYRELRPVRVDEGILVFEGVVVCGQPWTIHHFGLDFTKTGGQGWPSLINRLPCYALEAAIPFSSILTILMTTSVLFSSCLILKLVRYSTFHIWLLFLPSGNGMTTSRRRWTGVNRALDMRGKCPLFKSMGELRGSVAILYAPGCWMSNIFFCCFMCVLVGLTTVDKLAVFLHSL